MKRTNWFPVAITPVHNGTYEFKGQGLDGVKQLDWNGRTWGVWISTPGGLPVRYGYTVSIGDCWRGLTRRLG